MKAKTLIRSVIAFSGFLFFASAIAIPADLPPKSVVYYFGEPQMTNLLSGETTSQKVLLQRVTDPAMGYILEDGYAEDLGSTQCRHVPVYIVLAKNGAVTLTDVIDGSAKPSFQGTGQVMGDAWSWNYLKFSMTLSSNGMRIEDSNFLFPDQTLVARKQFFHAESATPFMLYDGSYFKIDKDQYEKLFLQMGCKTTTP